MSIWSLKKWRRKGNKKYLFEANSFQQYLVNRTKERLQTDPFKEIKWKEKEFIDKQNTPTIVTQKISDKNDLIEMDCDEEVDLDYYKQFSKSLTVNLTIAKSVPKPDCAPCTTSKPASKPKKSLSRKPKPT